MTAKPAEESVPPTLRVLAGITWRVLIVVAGLVLVGYVLGLIMPVVMAIIFAMLLTAWATPVMNLFHKVMPKVIAMVLALLLIVGIVVVILGAVIRSSITEGPKLAASISSGFEDIQEWLKTGPLQLSDDSINSLIQQAEDWGKNLLTGMLSGAVDALGSIGTLIIAASVFFFGVIFFMLNPSSIWGWLISWMPKSIQVPVDTSGHLAWDSISGYTRGIVIIAFSDAVLVYIGLLVLQVPLAPALAALVFLGAFIPVIGAPIATFFAALVALAERGLLVAVLVVALTVVVGSFDGDVLQPLVMGKAVNLHPLAIVFAIAAGGIAMGIIGALIAVPVAGAIYSVAKYVTGRDPEHPYPQPEEIPVPVSP